MAAEEDFAIFDEKFEFLNFEGYSCKSFQDGWSYKIKDIEMCLDTPIDTVHLC